MPKTQKLLTKKVVGVCLLEIVQTWYGSNFYGSLTNLYGPPQTKKIWRPFSSSELQIDRDGAFALAVPVRSGCGRNRGVHS
jgi:hypothetical protein